MIETIREWVDDPKIHVVIVAGSYERFRNYCEKRRINPSYVKYATSPHALKNIPAGFKVISTSGGNQRDDIWCSLRGRRYEKVIDDLC